MNLDADAFLISSRALMIAQITAVKIDAESYNRTENSVSIILYYIILRYDRKTR